MGFWVVVKWSVARFWNRMLTQNPRIDFTHLINADGHSEDHRCSSLTDSQEMLFLLQLVATQSGWMFPPRFEITSSSSLIALTSLLWQTWFPLQLVCTQRRSWDVFVDGPHFLPFLKGPKISPDPSSFPFPAVIQTKLFCVWSWVLCVLPFSIWMASVDS